MPPAHNDARPLNVLFVTPECAPIAKTGGLGDVSAALPPALREEGIDARVLLPGYTSVLDAFPAAREVAALEVLGQPVRLLESVLATGVPLVIVDCPHLYARGGGPYQADDGDDWDDNALRFGVLAKAAAICGSEATPLSWRPDIVHCNDWPTALVPVYLAFTEGKRAATMITIHNLAFQGLFQFSDIRALEIPEAALGADGMEFHGRASFLKGALLHADAITTVSPTYAQEIQGPELGFGLEDVLKARRDALFGVLNGIDTATWNPATDPNIARPYGLLTLERKMASKRALKKRMKLAGSDDIPLLATVSRITHQKGIDVIASTLGEITKLAQVVVVGAGDREMIEQLKAAQARHPGRVGLSIGFDEPLAHLVEAGADIFLMPSRFEPCGMNQMYSQRYGTPPIANATGGLVDTIVDDATGDTLDGTGFLIPEASPDALLEGVVRALAARSNPSHWKRLQTNGMTRDFGWEPAARMYRRIYERIRPTS